MKLILLGAPGAGKGTQAELLSERLKIPAISTGNIIREAIRNQTESGVKAREYVEKGDLVPDGIVVEMLTERIARPDCADGFILDGFPRNVAQAETLDKMGVVVEKVIDFEVPDGIIEQRLSGRRVCESCGASYHMEHKRPKTPGVCDRCGGALIARKDDEPATVRERLKIYHRLTEPLKDYYHAAGKLYVVEGQAAVSETTRLTLAALEA